LPSDTLPSLILLSLLSLSSMSHEFYYGHLSVLSNHFHSCQLVQPLPHLDNRPKRLLVPPDIPEHFSLQPLVNLLHMRTSHFKTQVRSFLLLTNRFKTVEDFPPPYSSLFALAVVLAFITGS
jgi:hypothetical protein